MKGLQPMHEFLTAWNNHVHTSIPIESELESRFPLIAEIFDQPSLSDIFDALENKQDVPWLKQTLDRLKMCSPLMLHVTFRLQKLGYFFKTLEEALNLEFRVALNMLDCDEFKRGIEARIINRKEQKEPKWLYPDIYSVPNDVIAKFFKEHPYESELDLQPCFPGIVPSTDPFRIYFAEIENKMLEGESFDWLISANIDDIIPPQQQNITNIKKLYASLLQQSDMPTIVPQFFDEGLIIEQILQASTDRTEDEDDEEMEGANLFTQK